MKNKNRKSSLSSGILLFTLGGIFTAIGITMTVIVIRGLIKSASDVGAGILLPIVMILALLGFGITALVMGGKQIYSRIRQSITYRHGKENTATIINYKTASFGRGGNTRRRYALVLSYVKILLILWRTFFLVAFIFLIISFFIKNSSVTTAAIITIFAVNFPFVIPLSIYLIQWIIRKK